MVLESLLSVEKIRERKIYPFLLGILYSSVSIFVAMWLFPDNFIVFATALTSLLFLPLISRLLEIEKNIETRREKFGLKDFFKEHGDIFKIYLCMFLGIILSFSIFSVITPDAILNHLFENQAVLVSSLRPDPAALEFGDFFMIIGNNMKVLIVCYLASYFFGTGAIFIISWNASVWGTVFGSIIRNSAFSTAQNPLLFSVLLGIIILPYLIIEASAYFLAGISGGIVSRATMSESIHSRKFETIVKKSLIILWISLFLIFISALVESQLAPAMSGILL